MTSPSKETGRAINPNTGRPFPEIDEYFPRAHRTDVKAKLFISNISIGDRREVLQGDGHRNQLVAICITPEIAEKVVRAVNCDHHFDELVKALESAPRPRPSTDPVKYMDWYFKVRAATLSRIKTEG